MGMVLEIWQKDQFLYAKIPVKDFDTKDLQGMILEAESAKVSSGTFSPDALYLSLKRQTPNEGNHIRQAEKVISGSIKQKRPLESIRLIASGITNSQSGRGKTYSSMATRTQMDISLKTAKDRGHWRSASLSKIP